jgi:hypothetical protein
MFSEAAIACDRSKTFEPDNIAVGSSSEEILNCSDADNESLLLTTSDLVIG